MKPTLMSSEQFYHRMRNGMFCVLLTDAVKHKGLTDRDPVTYPLFGVAVTPDGSGFELVRWTAEGQYQADGTTHDYDITAESVTAISPKAEDTLSLGINTAAEQLHRITQEVIEAKLLSEQAAKTAYIN